MNILVQILILLPDLIKLLTAIDKNIKDQESDRKIKDDIKQIREAFSSQDANKLNAIFNPNFVPDNAADTTKK